jgi:hypothetical protein
MFDINDYADPDLKKSLSELSPDRLAQAVANAGYGWSEKDGAASALEETKKTLLAKLTLEYMEFGVAAGSGARAGKPLTRAEAEVRAMADKRYIEFVTNMVKAREDSNRARVKYDTGKIYIEMLRSRQATLRAEMNFSGMQT